MSHLIESSEPVDFWVWVNPENRLVKHQITVIGGFFSGGFFGDRKTNLCFIPNPDFQGDITPFQHGIIRDYWVDYNLELSRERFFPNYPSRLNAIFLFLSEESAINYKKIHSDHVNKRILKKCHSIGAYKYSFHDLSWVDFLRISGMIDPQSLDNICKSYWKGDLVQNCSLMSFGEPWTQEVVLETLFVGRIEFYDRSLDP